MTNGTTVDRAFALERVKIGVRLSEGPELLSTFDDDVVGAFVDDIDGAGVGGEDIGVTGTGDPNVDDLVGEVVADSVVGVGTGAGVGRFVGLLVG